MTRLILAYLPLLVWAAAVLAVGRFDFHTASLPSMSDKAAHFLAYGVGGALAAVAGRVRGGGSAVLGLLFVALVAAADEVHQIGLAHRDGDPWDWVADMAGALAFHVAARVVLGKRTGGG